MSKSKGKAILKRRRARRDPYDYVLIVCEGEKTEPTYFQRLKRSLKLNTANIAVVSGDGTDPMSIVNTAIKLFSEDRKYDSVYCVFDKDSHPTYDAALDKIRNTKLKKAARNGSTHSNFESCRSVPCFEFWFLLHFERSRKPRDLGNHMVVQVNCPLVRKLSET